jgi:hypothetical protein
MIKQAKYPLDKTCLLPTLKASLLFGFLSFGHTSFSQPGVTDTAVKEAIEHAINTLPEGQRGIYNGSDYTPTTLTAGGHPFLLTGDLNPETIVFDGIAYSEINLLYDADQERVVIENHAGNKICPPVEKIEMFSLGASTFKRFQIFMDYLMVSMMSWLPENCMHIGLSLSKDFNGKPPLLTISSMRDIHFI